MHETAAVELALSREGKTVILKFIVDGFLVIKYQLFFVPAGEENFQIFYCAIIVIVVVICKLEAERKKIKNDKTSFFRFHFGQEANEIPSGTLTSPRPPCHLSKASEKY